MGWLAMPMAVDDKLAWALVFNLALHGLLVAVLAVMPCRRAWERLAMFAGAWLILLGAGLPREHHRLLSTLIRSATPRCALGRPPRWLPGAAILAAVFLSSFHWGSRPWPPWACFTC